MSDVLFHYSVIVDKYKYTFEQLSKMTDFQIYKILFAKRKKTGEVEKPERPVLNPSSTPMRRGKKETTKTRRDEYMESYSLLFNAMQLKSITKANFDESIDKLQKKFWADFPEWHKRVEEKEEPVKQKVSIEQSILELDKVRIAGLLSQSDYDAAVQKLRQLSK